MKSFRKLCAALVLTLSLALPVLAGDMPAPGAIAVSPRQQSSTTCMVSKSSESTLGDMPAPGMTELDSMTTLTLGLFESILSIF